MAFAMTVRPPIPPAASAAKVAGRLLFTVEPQMRSWHSRSRGQHTAEQNSGLLMLGQCPLSIWLVTCGQEAGAPAH